jgi:hypothetical protein
MPVLSRTLVCNVRKELFTGGFSPSVPYKVVRSVSLSLSLVSLSVRNASIFAFGNLNESLLI